MDQWTFWVGLVVLASLTVFTTLNLALRIPSRVRIAKQFEKARRGDVFESFVAMRSEYMLATSILRSACTLGVFLVALGYPAHPDGQASSLSATRTVVDFGVALALVLVFGVAIPTAWAKYAGEWLIVRVLPVLIVTRVLFYPLIWFLGLFDPIVRRLTGVPIRDAKSYADELEQEILTVVSEGELHGAVDEQEKEMIESVIELTETRVAEIMTPRTDIVAVPIDADLDAVLDVIRRKGHSRIPVYEQTIDRVQGVLYAKDLLGRSGDEPFQLESMMRKAVFIPESKSVRTLLRDFQESKVHMAVVLDEYGGTAGLVTIEDIVEELVGEIADEYEPTAPQELKRINNRTVEVDARMQIDDLNDELEISLPDDEDYETIGGFVFSKLGKIPSVGERCDQPDVAIEVIGAEPRRITRLRLTLQSTPSEDDSDRA